MPVKWTLAIPSALFSLLGALSLAAWLIFGVPYADIAAFLLLGAVGFGISIAFFAEIRRQRQPWTWVGIFQALHNPSRNFILAILSHAPQLLIAIAIAFYWRSRQK